MPDIQRAIRTSLALAPVLVAALLGSGCARSTGEPNEADAQAIYDVLEGYMGGLAVAYRSGNVEALRPFAVEKELATVFKRVSDLMEQEGRIVDSTLKSFEVEKSTIWNHSNAFATTMEVWDIRALASGSESVMSEALGQRNRVKYQLKRTDEGWRVLYRLRDPEFEKEETED